MAVNFDMLIKDLYIVFDQIIEAMEEADYDLLDNYDRKVTKALNDFEENLDDLIDTRTDSGDLSTYEAEAPDESDVLSEEENIDDSVEILEVDDSEEIDESLEYEEKTPEEEDTQAINIKGSNNRPITIKININGANE